MSNYTNTFGASTKDATQATITAADIGTELDNVATAVATKADKLIPAATGNIATLDASGNLSDGGSLVSALLSTTDWNKYNSYASITPSSDADVTLTADQAKYGRLVISTGSWLIARNIIVPTTQKVYWIDNGGTYNATIKTATGTGITVLVGTSKPVICDGTNVVDPHPDQLASSAEVITGTNTTKSITPSSFRGGAIVSGTATSASGTSVDFTGIPSWAKRVIVMLDGISTNGTTAYRIQVGAGSVTTTGYIGATANQGSGVATYSAYTDGFDVGTNGAVANTLTGTFTLHLRGSNIWVFSGVGAYENVAYLAPAAGKITLAGALDRVRVTTANGTDTFDSGTINIMWE